MPTIHNFPGATSAEIYDLSQTTDGITDGDVLVMDNAVAIMVQAWPTLYKGEQGQLHALAVDKGYDWGTLDEGRYVASVELADSIAIVDVNAPASYSPKP